MFEPSATPRRFPPLLVVGVTGGIASGKTTITKMFAGLGAAVLNADDEGRVVLEPGEPGLAEVIRAFGGNVLLPDGRLNRGLLSERIFAVSADRQILNRITHPRIAQRLQLKLERLRKDPPESRIVVLEAAILVEAGWAALADKVLVVATQHSQQLARLTARSGLSVEEAEARIRAQLPLRRRLRHADYRVSGDAAISQTTAQVERIWSELRRLADRGTT